MKAWLFLTLITLGSMADGYRILCLFGIPSKSHEYLGKGVVNALLKAGHEVTLLTAFPPKEPLPKGLSIIDASVIIPEIDVVDMTDKRNSGFYYLRWLSNKIFTISVGIPELRKELSQGQYDAVITEYFFNDMDAGFAAVLQVPWILLSTVVLQPAVEVKVDDIKSLSTVPMLLNDFPIPMSFWQRVVNVGMYLAMEMERWWTRPTTLANYEAAFAHIAAARGIPLPPLDEVVHNVSILFVNAHSSFAPALSVPPNVIDIGGYHIEETIVPLPKDLQELLDKSTQGVVYFSMGSVIKSSKLPVDTRKNLLRMLGELPYTVLWKFEEDMKVELPKNVHIRPWMPQAAILAHSNTKVFITHGGLLSTLEALYYGVPLITIPVFGDQPANAARAVRAGYALRVRFGLDAMDPMVEELKAALQEIFSNDSYYKQAKYLSFLFNKRPVPPAKLISHYVELAIETKGAYHLRSNSKKYAWYQRLMIDQLVVLLAILYMLYRIIRKMINVLFAKVKTPKKVTRKSKKN